MEGFEAIGDGVVFCGAGDEVIFFGVETAGGEDGGVVGFGAAAGEDDFVGVAVEEGGGLFAGEVDCFADGFGGGVGAGGVGEVILEEREHGLEDGGVELRGGVVVEVDHAGWRVMACGWRGCKPGEMGRTWLGVERWALALGGRSGQGAGLPRGSGRWRFENKMAARQRLDAELAARGLVDSREQGRRLVLAGEVRVNGVPAAKPGQAVSADDVLEVLEKPKYVSRGGLKLEGALGHFGIDVAGMVAMDVGASTGGFTDCLLQHGAAKVYAFDVGTNQLAWRIRSDARVVAREQYNVRHLDPADVPEAPDLAVFDVSFISLRLVLPPVMKVLGVSGQIVCLIKPQFELTRGDIGPGGIVRDPALHERAVATIRGFVEGCPGFQWRGHMDSPITGTDGNKEFLAWITRAPV